MKKKLIFGIVFILIVLAVIFVFSGAGKGDSVQTGLINGAVVGKQSAGENVVQMTAESFEPKVLMVNRGESVVFVNLDSEKHWPATDVHPSHQVYPGSDIKKCRTAEANPIFDSCKGLGERESFTFVFNEIGIWKYHDHLNAGLTGTIIVN